MQKLQGHALDYQKSLLILKLKLPKKKQDWQKITN